MATNKTLTPTNVTIQIPEFTDQPDQRVNSNCIDKEADAINALNTAVATANTKKPTILNSTNVTSDSSILSLDNGAYQVASSGDVSPYLPYKYGTLYVAKSSNNYGMFLFEATVGTYFIRHRANATTWSGDWQQLATKSDYAEVSGTMSASLNTWVETAFPTGFSGSNSYVIGYKTYNSGNSKWYLNHVEVTADAVEGIGIRMKTSSDGFKGNPFKVLLKKI